MCIKSPGSIPPVPSISKDNSAGISEFKSNCAVGELAFKKLFNADCAGSSKSKCLVSLSYV